MNLHDALNTLVDAALDDLPRDEDTVTRHERSGCGFAAPGPGPASRVGFSLPGDHGPDGFAAGTPTSRQVAHPRVVVLADGPEPVYDALPPRLTGGCRLPSLSPGRSAGGRQVTYTATATANNTTARLNAPPALRPRTCARPTRRLAGGESVAGRRRAPP
jgi:hypothetical protein